MSDGVCSGFEPQNYLRERCKKCFRLRSKHSAEPVSLSETLSTSSQQQQPHQQYSSTSNSIMPATPSLITVPTSVDPSPQPSSPNNNPTLTSNPSTSSLRSGQSEKRRSWRDPHLSDGVTSPEYETADNLTETSSLVSFKSANSRLLSNAKSLESISSIMDDRSMVTAASGSLEFDEQDEERAMTPTEISEYDARKLRSENGRLQEQVFRLKAERQRWVSTRPKTRDQTHDEDLIQMLEERLNEAENLIEEYRNENSNLTYELRKRQQEGGTNNRASQAPTLTEQLDAAEDLCKDLMEENKQLKSDIQGLQQEVEEMQDQFREEEIEEFRELQRELEQNAKNCRVLQFKLRKSERQREQILAEKEVLTMKLEEQRSSAAAVANGKTDEEDVEMVEVDSDDALSVSNGAASESALSAQTNSRMRELESELRIAKEVSVRLHNDLESAEDKRYKLEDEVFYYKEKLRELQTQNKWRDNRNRAEQAVKRQSLELAADPSRDGNYSKELCDVLERERDLIEQLRFTEDDLKRTRSRMQELENENEELLQKLTRLASNPTGRSSINKRPPMSRSASEGHAQIRLELATAELEHLGARCDQLERKNNALTKKMLELEIDTAKKLNALDAGAEVDKEGNFRLNVEIEKDIGRLMARIHDLEKRNSELQIQLRKKITSDTSAVRDKTTSVELRKEKQHRKELEVELSEWKQLIAKSDNNKLISMATKVELLTNQLNMAIERANVLHKKAIKESGSATEESYADQLKQQIEQLERQLSEARAIETFKAQKCTTDENNGQEQLPTADEIEHCCVVLASVEAQTNRLCKQMEKLDNSQKDERRRSLSKETGATIAADLANIMAELKVIHQVLETHKVSYPSLSRRSPVKEPSVASSQLAASPECSECRQKDEQVESSKQEIAFYKKKNKELTNQVLQTEDRWTIEIERQTHSYITQIRKLEADLDETKSHLKEQVEIANSRAATCTEQEKFIEEQMTKINRLEMEINDRQKTIQEMEKEHRGLKEWSIKYRKLENLYDSEKQKYDAERSKIKAETASLKKRTDDAVNELERLRESNERRDRGWQEERSRLEKEINFLKKLGKTSMKKSFEEQETDEEEQHMDRSLASYRSLGNPSNGGTGPAVRAVNYRVTRVNDLGVPELKQQLADQQKKYNELENKMYQLQSAKENLDTEMNRLHESYEREKESLSHRARQAEKIRSFELDALQQKFTSRMNIMENTNKSLHTQLVQIRRDRDRHRDQMHSTEKRLEEEHKIAETERKRSSTLALQNAELEKKIKELTSEISRLRTELRLATDAHKADKKLWIIERQNYRRESVGRGTTNNEEEEKDSRRITAKALEAAEAVQKQYAEYQKFYNKEITRLNSKIRELSSDMQTKDTDHRRKTATLSEQIKILEIDQNNLVQAKEMQLNAREVLQADQERLMQIIQQMEIQKLTRKYKITAIVDRLTTIQEPKEDTELAHIIAQLTSIKEEDCQGAFISEDAAGELQDDRNTATFDHRSATLDRLGAPPRAIGSISARAPMFASGSSVLSPAQRSLSIESTATWDGRLFDYSARSTSPVKKALYPDPPPNFVHNMDKLPYYDRSGRLHYVPKTLMGLIGRSLSYDQYGEHPPQMKSTGTLTDDGDPDEPTMVPHNRSGSAGTNILYKIRREELAKGTQPSVRKIAQAFESIDNKPAKTTLKRRFFNIRKSRSVDTNDGATETKGSTLADSNKLPTALNRNTTSMSQIEDTLGSSMSSSLPRNPMSASAYTTMIRGGRNPFKNMGSKLVERVRRSLSRSGRDRTPDSAPLALNEETSPLEEQKPPIGQPSPPKPRVKSSKSSGGTTTQKKPTIV